MVYFEPKMHNFSPGEKTEGPTKLHWTVKLIGIKGTEWMSKVFFLFFFLGGGCVFFFLARITKGKSLRKINDKRVKII